jgi:hypothetical protein
VELQAKKNDQPGEGERLVPVEVSVADTCAEFMSFG